MYMCVCVCVCVCIYIYERFLSEPSQPKSSHLHGNFDTQTKVCISTRGSTIVPYSLYVAAGSCNECALRIKAYRAPKFGKWK